MSCGRAPLPDVPAFEKLGFADALDVVRLQVFDAYARWQEKPLDARLNGRLGMLLSAYGKNSASEVLYRRARILAPAEFRWTYYLAVTLVQLGRYEEAARMFRGALEINPEYVAARIQLAGLLLQINAIEESVELYQEISAEFPERVEGWLGLGKALDRSGDLAGAKVALQRARTVGPQYGEVRYALAVVLSASGDEERAVHEFAAYERTANNTIRTPDPLTLEVIRLNAGDAPHMARADNQLQRGELEKAVTSFRAALAVNPVNQDAWGGVVQSLARLGKLDETGDSYRAALAAGVSYKRLHLTYGQALRQWQQLDAARDVIGKAIELDPQYAEALFEMGNLEMQSGESAAAVGLFRRCLSVAPNNRSVMLSLARALNATDQFDEAVARAEPLTSDPAADISFALKELAIAYRGLDRKEDAINALKRGREAAAKSSNTLRVDTFDALLAEWQKDTAE